MELRRGARLADLFCGLAASATGWVFAQSFATGMSTMRIAPGQSWELALSATRQSRSQIADEEWDLFANTPPQRLPTLDRLAHHVRRRALHGDNSSAAELFREFGGRCFRNKTAACP